MNKRRSLWPPDKSQDSNVLSTFSQPLNAISLAMLGLSQTEMIDFPTLSYTSMSEIPTLSDDIPETWKSLLFRAEPPRKGHL